MLHTHDPREFIAIDINDDGQPHPSYRIELIHVTSDEEQQRLSTATVSRATLAAIAHRAIDLLAAVPVNAYGQYPDAVTHPQGTPRGFGAELPKRADPQVVDCAQEFTVRPPDGDTPEQTAICARPMYHLGDHMSAPVPPIRNTLFDNLPRRGLPAAPHPAAYRPELDPLTGDIAARLNAYDRHKCPVCKAGQVVPGLGTCQQCHDDNNADARAELDERARREGLLTEATAEYPTEQMVQGWAEHNDHAAGALDESRET